MLWLLSCCALRFEKKLCLYYKSTVIFFSWWYVKIAEVKFKIKLLVSVIRTTSRSGTGQDDGSVPVPPGKRCVPTLLQTAPGPAFAHKQEHLG